MSPTLVDAHAHLHARYDVGTTLDIAAEAFRRARSEMLAPLEGEDCLILGDHAGAEGFRRLCDAQGERWAVTRLDSVSLKAERRSDAAGLLIFSGRQVRAANGLEVLGLLVEEQIPDGGTLLDRTASILDEGGVAALPWGFGKWWGGRGEEVLDLLRSSMGRRIALVDSGTRPPGPIWNGRAQFELANHLRIPILAGTDPLPLPGDERRLGSYGLMIDGAVDHSRPSVSMHGLLRSPPSSAATFGRRVTLVRGLGLQVAMQLRR